MGGSTGGAQDRDLKSLIADELAKYTEFVEGEQKKLEEEEEEFRRGMEQTKREFEAESVDKIAVVENKLKHIALAVKALTTKSNPPCTREEADEMEQSVKELRAESRALKAELMDLEQIQKEQFMEVIALLDKNYDNMVKVCNENTKDTWDVLRKFQLDYHTQVMQLATDKLDEYAKNSADDSWVMPEIQEVMEKTESDILHGNMDESDRDELIANIKDMLEDRETLLNAVANSHDKHVEIMDKLESSLVAEANRRYNNLLTSIREAEFERNRMRVNEIMHLVDLHFGNRFEELMKILSEAGTDVTNNGDEEED